MTNGPTQRETCAGCNTQYDYEPNPEFRPDLYPGLASLSQPMKDRMQWRIIGHPVCLAARESRQIAENQREIDERRAGLLEHRQRWRRESVEEWYTKPALPFDARSKTFENYTASIENEDTVAMVRSWVASDGFGLLIMGPAGTGKSHLGFAAIGKIFESYLAEDLSGLADDDLIWVDQHPTATYVPVAGFLASLRADGGKSDVWFLDSKLLFLDDLGSENMTDWSREIFFRIFDHRLNRNLPTIVTTNLGLNELKERLHERVVSRILASSVPVILKGGDYRLNHMRQNAKLLTDRARASA